MLTPNYILKFGYNSNLSLLKVYKYDSEYLIWLIESIPGFSIDIPSFYSLGKPFNLDSVDINNLSLENKIKVIMARGNNLTGAKQIEVLEDLQDSKNVDFKEFETFEFSPKVQLLNNSKNIRDFYNSHLHQNWTNQSRFWWNRGGNENKF